MYKKSICLILLLLVLGFIQTSVMAAPGDLLQTFLNPTPQENDWFGISIAVAGNRILVGAPFDDTVDSNSGAAYLFDVNGTLLQTLLPPAPATGDWFGFRVYPSGNDFFVFAFYDDMGATNSGAVYKFDGSTGVLLHTFTPPSPDGEDRFGFPTVTMGNKILIGCIHNNTGATKAGAVYVFDGSTGALLHTIYNPTPVKNETFGYSIAVLGDKIVVGSFDSKYGYGSGAVYVFDGSTYSLLRTIYDPTPTGRDLFGGTVAAVGNNILVSAGFDDTAATDSGTAYLFDVNGNLLQEFYNPTPQENDMFGSSVAAVGGNILVGALYDDTAGDNAGAVYLFSQNGTLLHTFLPEPPGGLFGISVKALGNNILVGAHLDDTGAKDAGIVYLFEGYPSQPLAKPAQKSTKKKSE